jgi:hypothetical protein
MSAEPADNNNACREINLGDQAETIAAYLENVVIADLVS